MKLADVKLVAAEKGVKAGKMTKQELIRAIQLTEGNSTCYATGQADSCNQSSCLWRQDCH